MLGLMKMELPDYNIVVLDVEHLAQQLFQAFN